MKSNYFVSVQAKTIMEHQGDAAYELEITAAPEEIERLSALLEEMGDYDHGSLFKAHMYTYPYHVDPENDGYDYDLREVYGFLYEHGTAKTKQFIENTGLLQLQPNDG